jgi:multicomponent Na+:H+ antiporter subunit E
VLEIDQTRRMIYVHVIDAGSERSVQRFYRQVGDIERLMIASFEREADWRPSGTAERLREEASETERGTSG